MLGPGHTRIDYWALPFSSQCGGEDRSGNNSEQGRVPGALAKKRAEEVVCSGSLNGRSSSQQREEVGRGTEGRTQKSAHWMAGECQGDRGKRCLSLVMTLHAGNEGLYPGCTKGKGRLLA